MRVLDEHGNYGAVVRFTPQEWGAAKALFGPIEDGDDDE